MCIYLKIVKCIKKFKLLKKNQSKKDIFNAQLIK